MKDRRSRAKKCSSIWTAVCDNPLRVKDHRQNNPQRLANATILQAEHGLEHVLNFAEAFDATLSE
jgi:hypothetical protein